MKIEGSTILTVSMEGYEENFKRYNAVEMGWEKDLLQFQRLFKKFKNKFHEYVEEPLFNCRSESAGKWQLPQKEVCHRFFLPRHCHQRPSPLET